ncbi:DNA-directed RNA polymerase subunit beta' [Clostridiaceae bacterium HSG29]|nr:DNA-directed RNA polymerase subunit beta' [Clostridiaceae bacterium HSG29]
MEFKNFDKIKIGLASPEDIRSWSYGEVKKPETINYRTLKPEDDGLFCERIFGPTKDLQCACGKYKRIRYKGVVCEKCGVEVTKSKVRRERMGHIELAAPVSHIWFFKGIPSKLGILLDMSPRSLEKVLYFASYIVLDSGDTSLTYKQLLTEREYSEAKEKFGDEFRAGMGAESIKEILKKLNVEAEITELTASVDEVKGQKRKKVLRRLKLLRSLLASGNKPEWVILDVLPVIPPDIRPMVQLDGGRFATSDLNDLYRRVINRNNRLKRLSSLGAPEIIVRNEKRMLQESVDALIDNGRRGRPVTGSGNRPLKSLSDMLKGKQGRFRQNLLGKRVDYSGRSVIVVGPTLKFYQCGLPKTMALELFKPFVMRKLVADGIVHNIKSAKRIIEKMKPEVWPVVEHVIKNHPVLLNRAPTLHRLGIQAFEPVLIEGKAIRLHPLVCPPYNADFDGDQMAVHLPLSVEAQAESRFLMLSVNNILAPKDGEPITLPSQDMILGAYYLTLLRREDEGYVTNKIFKDFNEMYMAYQNDYVKLHSVIKVRMYSEVTGKSKLVESTVGRFIFNEGIPQDLGYVDREKDPYSLEIDFLAGKKQLADIVARCFKIHRNIITAQVLDYIKNTGFKYSTKTAISISVTDMKIPEKKVQLLAEAHKVVDRYQEAYLRGLISNSERYEKTIAQWAQTTEDVTDALMDNLTYMNSLNIMADSGARGSRSQIRQLAGMRGLMANAVGKTVEIPITSNFREGLSVLEYFISTTGARKGLADTALRTADSGYLTRRLVDVSQDVIVRELDCGAESGVLLSEIREGNEVIELLEERIYGRYPIADMYYPGTTDLIISKDEMFTKELAKEVVNAGYEEIEVRSVLGCNAKKGVCSKCYGLNMATGKTVHVGEAVGIIAAQSIGEPGTQLTMRTFHTGGVAGGDITQGLPRIEQLFEARTPKYLANIAEQSGKVILRTRRNKREVLITDDEGNTSVARLAFNAKLKVSEGDYVEKGQYLTEGAADPKEILVINGVKAVQEYIVKEIQKVYRLQGVEIADKHTEIIIKQMLNKIRITVAGGSDLLPSEEIYFSKFKRINKKLIEEGKEPMEGERIIQGITKASLATDSFLSAASFQETTRVLTGAAMEGAVDNLEGLKENVIIGKLIPAGTGLKRYQDIAIQNKNDINE